MKLTLRWKITFWAFGVVLISILVAGLLLSWNAQADFQDELGRRALAIGRTVAQTPNIISSVGKEEGAQIIQPLAERIRLANNVDYIVVLDMKHKRYSHPVANRIGQVFTGGDEDPSFADNEYTSLAKGVLGNAVRAFVPIKNEEGTQQLGVVVVGILTPSLGDILFDMKAGINGALLIGLLVGAGGAIILAKSIKREILGLEPEEIATIVEQREALLEAISEGIIAVDSKGRINLINQAALRILNFTLEDVMGKPILSVIPHSRLFDVVTDGLVRYNEEVLVGSTVVLCNRVPLRIKGKIVGAVSVFRDKTDVRELAEELTGVKKFVEALRVQNHENLNKLHTIAGLIQLDCSDEALDYIFETTEAQQQLTGFLSRNIKDYGVAGLLMGKLGRAKELGIDFEVDDKSRLDKIPIQMGSSDLVVILGNLLENAMEAVAQLPREKRWVRCGIKNKKDRLILWVMDGGTGVGLTAKEIDVIFNLGYSTKGSDNRGVGLYLVKKKVESADGKIAVRTRIDKGTLFFISLPLKEDGINEEN